MSASSSVNLQRVIIQRQFDRTFQSMYSTCSKTNQHRLIGTKSQRIFSSHNTTRSISTTRSFSTTKCNLSIAPSRSRTLSKTQARQHSTSSSNMSVTFSKQTIRSGNGTQRPKVGDTVLMEYTGWLYDPSKPKNRGQQFDSSVGRGDFKTAIGVGRVIKGWDQGVPQMTVGERAILTIPGDMAYGSRGFPGLIPANAALLFEVELKAINP